MKVEIEIFFYVIICVIYCNPYFNNLVKGAVLRKNRNLRIISFNYVQYNQPVKPVNCYYKYWFPTIDLCLNMGLL